MNIECNPQVLFWMIIILIICTILGFILGRMRGNEDMNQRVEDMVNERMRLMHGTRNVFYTEEKLQIIDLIAECEVPSHLPIERVKKDLAIEIGNHIIKENLLFKYFRTEGHLPEGHPWTVRHRIEMKVVKPKESKFNYLNPEDEHKRSQVN